MHLVGIEIGGSKLQLGVGSGDGLELLAFQKLPAHADQGAEGIRGQIREAVRLLLEVAGLDRGAIAGVGVGFGGPVRADLATVTKSHQVAGWEGFPLAAWIQEEFGWRAIAHNDADTAALAEARFGAGRGHSPTFYITIGSGIGGGLVLDGKIYRGAGAGACEIGHLKVPDLETAANPWRSPEFWTTVESICSGWAIGRRASCYKGRPLMREYAIRGEVTAETVARAAHAGDQRALEVLDETWGVLAMAIAQVITLLCPRRIIIGGGVAAMGEELLFEPLRRKVASQVFPPFRDLCDIVPAALREKGVVYGALALARDAFLVTERTP